MLQVSVRFNQLIFGRSLAIEFQRTLRIPEDDETYPLPPGFGPFPIHRVEDYADRVPESWRAEGGFFIPLYQREALWINLLPRYWKPNAVKVAVGRVNALSGKTWTAELRARADDYLVTPPQHWLDGIHAGKGYVRQFVAMPLGMGYTVEAQISSEERFGGIQILVYEPKPGRFPDEPPAPQEGLRPVMAPMAGGEQRADMGVAAGGKIKQKIYPDPHGIDTWDAHNYGQANIHLVNSLLYQEITGQTPPETPVTMEAYAQHGIPWFVLYDEEMDDMAPADKLRRVEPTHELEGKAADAPG